MSADEWENIRTRDVAHVPSGWSEPEYLGVNDYNGCIDSLHVSDDGNTIYYTFYPGADLFNDSITGNLKGDADIYYSEWPFKEHKPLKKYFMSEQPFSACCVQLDAEGNFWYQSNREGRPGGSAQGNYDWHPVYRNDQLLAFNKKGRPFGDTFYCPAKDELWIPGGEDHAGGQMNILKNAKANNFSGKPEKAPQPMRDGGQPYLTPDCDTMYFTANFGDVPAQGPAIYKTERKGDKWSKPTAVAWSKLGVGEWTMTADGEKAFFVQLFRNDKNEMRIKAFSTEKKGSAAKRGGPAASSGEKKTSDPKTAGQPTEKSDKPSAPDPGKASQDLPLQSFMGFGSSENVNHTDAGLEWTYEFRKKDPFSVLVLGSPAIEDWQGMEIRIRSDNETTLALIFTEQGDVSYDYHAELPAKEWKTIRLSWKDFKIGEKPDPNGRLDLNRIKDFALFDFGGLFKGKKGKNTITIKSMQGF